MSLQIAFITVWIVGGVVSGLSLLLVTMVLWPKRFTSGIPYPIMTLFSVSFFNLTSSFLLLISIPYRVTQPSQPLSVSTVVFYGIFLVAFIPFSISPVLFALQYLGITDDKVILSAINKYFPERK